MATVRMLSGAVPSRTVSPTRSARSSASRRSTATVGSWASSGTVAPARRARAQPIRMQRSFIEGHHTYVRNAERRLDKIRRPHVDHVPWNLMAEGVLEAEIEEERVGTGAVVESNGVPEARDDLQPAGKVERPAYARIEEERVLTLPLVRPAHVLSREPHQLQHQVQVGSEEPDGASAKVAAQGGRALLEGVPGVGSPGESRVRVEGQPGSGPHAERQVGLQPYTAGAPAAALVAGGDQETEPRRHVHAVISASHELVSVVEGDVAEAGSVRLVQYRDRVAQLVGAPSERPLLGEGVGPRSAAIRAGERADMLHHTGLLIVRLFDQEAVVGDRREGRVLGGDRTGQECGGDQVARDHASQLRKV